MERLHPLHFRFETSGITRLSFGQGDLVLADLGLGHEYIPSDQINTDMENHPIYRWFSY